MSTATALLAALETAGVRVLRNGDVLRVEVPSDVPLDPFRERLRESKPALLALLRLQDEIVATASAARDAFDRHHYDRLWERWHALQNQETI